MFDYKAGEVWRRTVVNHLQVERLSLVHVVEVFHGDDQTQLQDGQTCSHTEKNPQILTCETEAES